MNKAVIFASFIAGAATGAVVAWKLLEEKYAQIAQEEIDSVKEVFVRRDPEKAEEIGMKSPDILAKEAVNKPDINEYAKKLAENGYTDYSTGSDKSKEAFMERPYVIAPEEFGELEDDGYETVSLSYFADKVLAEETGEPVEDVDFVVGFDSLTHFGEYEEDSVFVRNDRLKCDYEILLDTRMHKEVYKE